MEEIVSNSSPSSFDHRTDQSMRCDNNEGDSCHPDLVKIFKISRQSDTHNCSTSCKIRSRSSGSTCDIECGWRVVEMES